MTVEGREREDLYGVKKYEIALWGAGREGQLTHLVGKPCAVHLELCNDTLQRNSNRFDSNGLNWK